VRAFCALRGHPSPEVFHTNEGHAGFLGLERIREYAEQGLSFEEALEVGRAATVFTTHTPVPAGIDRFERSLIREHFADDPLLPIDRVLALGAETYADGDPEVFNMAVMGMRLAQRVNGVSLLHGQVSREMFAGLWPGFDTREVPIGSVTNGVHTPTWVAPEIEVLSQGDWERAATAPAVELWETRRLLRARLVAETRRRLRASWRQRGASGAELTWIDDVLDENVLTIGFARRVPSYKRLTLMLNDPATLAGLLNDPAQPVQIVVAGKAHPADEGGKGLIQQMVQFTDSADVRRRIVFLPDYDMAMARALVQGCDVWLNNPLRPLEACGTSGMKAGTAGGTSGTTAGTAGRSPRPTAWPTPPGATRSRPRPCTSCWASRWRRCSTTSTRTACRRAGSSGSGTRSARSARRCRPSGWSGSTCRPCTCRPRWPPVTWPTPGAGSRPRGSWRPGSIAWCGPGRRCGSSTWRPRPTGRPWGRR
jgi:starch phosphorylase